MNEKKKEAEKMEWKKIARGLAVYLAMFFTGKNFGGGLND